MFGAFKFNSVKRSMDAGAHGCDDYVIGIKFKGSKHHPQSLTISYKFLAFL